VTAARPATSSGLFGGWSYRELERNTARGTFAILLGLAALAWWATIDSARDMSSMVQGLVDVGRAMPFAMNAAVFMAMWTTMMVAMMFPSVAPILLLHRLVMRRRGVGVQPTIAFAGGYLVVWAALGVVPLVLLHSFQHTTEPSAGLARLAGVVLVLAGAYQFTRWKDTCLRACRSPMTFLATHDFGRGSVASFRTGASHGLYCAGCCWALMAVLFVVGLMSLAWMGVIAAVFLAEKTWRHGIGLTKLVGTAVLVLGLAVLAHPPLVDGLSTGGELDGRHPGGPAMVVH
jgi:predicted metal-binding membrane protein